MFEISWGEIFVVGAVGIAMTGRRDLPAACRFVGTQLGRVVGLLQGARARADQFAHQNELKQLQNEFRSGLRELDQVRMELAVAASSQGMIGRGLGATTASANRVGRSVTPSVASSHLATFPNSSVSPPTSSSATNVPVLSGLPPSVETSASLISNSPHATPTKNDSTKKAVPSMDLFDFHVVEDKDDKSTSDKDATSPSVVTHTERAVMEEEWEKQGIGFRAMAEQGQWKPPISSHGSTTSWDTSKATGSELLEYLERQCLIFDQYDRAVAKEDRAVQERMLQKQKQEPKKE